MIQNFCSANLRQIKHLLEELTLAQYTHASQWLSGATIGQHARHVIEFYVCLLFNNNRIVNYDNRKRDLALETSADAAILAITEIATHLNAMQEDYPLTLQGDFSENSVHHIQLLSSFHRELAYCLEHSIHHQALIKIGLIELGALHLIDESFGVAPATLKFRSLVE